MLEDHIYPTDFFPFATATSRDPVTGVEGSVLDRARALGAVPKLFYVNNSSEYWNRAASLIATDPAGLHDLKPVPEERIYLIAGATATLGNAVQPSRSPCGAAGCIAHSCEPGGSDQEHDAVATVLIIGASRGIGLETMKAALEAGHLVRVLARSARRIPVDHPKLEKMAGDALENTL
jgi:hypothetical protein